MTPEMMWFVTGGVFCTMAAVVGLAIGLGLVEVLYEWLHGQRPAPPEPDMQPPMIRARIIRTTRAITPRPEPPKPGYRD